MHLAAKVGLGVDIDDMDDYVASNDHGTATCCAGRAAAGMHRLVLASSMVVYGEGRYTARTTVRCCRLREPARHWSEGCSSRPARSAVPSCIRVW